MQSVRLRAMPRLFSRSLTPPPVDPNDTVPPASDPGTVGPPTAVPGDPNGITLTTEPAQGGAGAFGILPSAWSGWPSSWWPPLWHGHLANLTDTAWMCIDLNASLLAAMPPYLVGAADNLDAAWLQNPDPDIYTCWDEFAKALFWDYQAVGEVFVLTTARYATGFPARFHVAPPWSVEVDFDDAGMRRYKIGNLPVPAGDMLHVRYTSVVGDAHGHGPLEAGRARMVAAEVLTQYGTTLAAGGGIPAGILTFGAEELTSDKAMELKAEWVAARASSIGEPAVLSNGITWEPTQVNPTDMALVDLLSFNESRIANLLGVPPFLVGLPSGDSMTYANATSVFDYHWRASLKPKAQMVTAALSGWLLPRGTTVELNRDSYVQPGPQERAQTYQILNGIQDQQANPVLSVEEIRAAERFNLTGQPVALAEGVLRG